MSATAEVESGSLTAAGVRRRMGDPRPLAVGGRLAPDAGRLCDSVVPRPPLDVLETVARLSLDSGRDDAESSDRASFGDVRGPGRRGTARSASGLSLKVDVGVRLGVTAVAAAAAACEPATDGCDRLLVVEAAKSVP